MSFLLWSLERDFSSFLNCVFKLLALYDETHRAFRAGILLSAQLIAVRYAGEFFPFHSVLRWFWLLCRSAVIKLSTHKSFASSSWVELDKAPNCAVHAQSTGAELGIHGSTRLTFAGCEFGWQEASLDCGLPAWGAAWIGSPGGGRRGCYNTAGPS